MFKNIIDQSVINLIIKDFSYNLGAFILFKLLIDNKKGGVKKW